MRWLLLLVVLCLAACSVPGLGEVTPAPVKDTAPHSARISEACRTQLGDIPHGEDLEHTADVSLAYWQVEGNQAEADRTLADFAWSAQQLGATACP